MVLYFGESEDYFCKYVQANQVTKEHGIAMDKKLTYEELEKRVQELEKIESEEKLVEEKLFEEIYFSQTLLQAAPVFFVAINAEGKTIMVNETMLHSLGYKQEEVVGKDYLTTFVPEKNREELSKIFDKLIQLKKPTLNENFIMTKDGKELLIEWHGRSIFNKKSEFSYFFGLGIDITERKQVEEKLRESEERYRSIFENAVEGLFQSTPEGRFISVNPSFARMLGYASPEELVSGTSDIAKQYYVNNEDRQRYEQLFKTAGFVENFEYKVQCKDGSHIWVSDNTRAIYDRDGKAARYEGYVTDITDQMQAKQELKLLNLKLKHEATHDPLTGALNRRAILDILSKELIRAKRRNTKISIGLCDIDHFKLVNDKHGHQAGDDVLCSFVKVMQNTLRPYDLLGRYGGEEFLLVMPDSTISAEEVLYERLRAKIADNKMMTRSGEVRITVSIGITCSNGDDTADAMIAKADAALYRAKENGRNKLAFAY